MVFSIPGIVGVEIRHMKVPPVLQNGSLPFVILDCDYDLSESEGYQVDVKWFFGSDPQPFYQWLPGRPPQTIGELFKNRIDLNYEVEGSDKFRKHRALKILRPTTELSGTYRCKVSSFIDEDFMQKTMTIYCKFIIVFTINFSKQSLLRANVKHAFYPKFMYGIYTFWILKTRKKLVNLHRCENKA